MDRTNEYRKVIQHIEEVSEGNPNAENKKAIRVLKDRLSEEVLRRNVGIRVKESIKIKKENQELKRFLRYIGFEDERKGKRVTKKERKDQIINFLNKYEKYNSSGKFE